MTCPVFAPLRRVAMPGLALLVDFSPASAHTVTAALARLEVRRDGLTSLSLTKPLLEMQHINTQTRPCKFLQALNLNMEKVEIGDLGSKENYGRAADDVLRSVLRQNISVCSLKISGFQLLRRGPGDQFYQKLLRTGKITKTSQ